MFRHFLTKAVLFSLAAHLVSLWSLNFVARVLTPPQTEYIALDLIAAPPSITPVPAVSEKNPEPEKKNQIVDQDERPVNKETPEQSRFLSRHNQKVEKQTVAQNHGLFQNKKEKIAGEEDPETEGAPKPINSFKDLTPRFKLDDSLAVQTQQNENQDNKVANMERHKKSGAQAGAEVSQTLDYIKELDPGLETMLSTREFVYYSYYNRIRTQLAQHWESLVKERLENLYRSGRSIASSDDKVTKVLITLDQGGKLVKVQIIGNSGVHDLDSAAVDAFRAAAPFPNPPNGMVEDDGTIKIRWDFILEG